ncbi:hypothetical protein SAMN02745947_05163 [Rhodococcus rhodochrous J3]|jgi:hypothetical protein|uniref:Uncharacterized protein n=2 Tax=Rhodococcus rhodochrous TaxID=1829 RepID=A0A562E3K4_RHORH|nr:hypothetical protein [Rhodococcus rhodochrous]TWH16284.1 hypothetical protein L618_002600000120 [Rhodococcus rhodochrous J45]TWH44452.1 hypothetical protein L612_003100000210 [Rhodococcus rhodochrous J38]SMG58034.1 hypothetical protein SAMN02745947_05163 [Rhodococcus rhodochrous J3]
MMEGLRRRCVTLQVVGGRRTCPRTDPFAAGGGAVVAGVDTHSDIHYVAVLGITGTRLGDFSVPATSTSDEQLLGYI